MSFIYDALKRAEDDNQRTMGTIRVSSRDTLLGKRRQQWMWVLIGVLGANVIVVSTLVVALGYRSSGTPAVAPEPHVAATSAPAPPPAPIEPAPAARPSPPPPVASVPAAQATKAPAAAVEPPTIVVPPRVPRSSSAAAAPAPRVVPGPATTEEPRPRGRDETVASLVEREQAMNASKMMRREQRFPEPPARRSPATVDSAAAAARPGAAPSIAVQVIVYSDVPAQRMAFIDGRRFAEGDLIDAETTLERINEDGIVVRRGGVRYVVLSRKD